MLESLGQWVGCKCSSRIKHLAEDLAPRPSPDLAFAPLRSPLRLSHIVKAWIVDYCELSVLLLRLVQLDGLLEGSVRPKISCTQRRACYWRGVVAPEPLFDCSPLVGVPLVVNDRVLHNLVRDWADERARHGGHGRHVALSCVGGLLRCPSEVSVGMPRLSFRSLRYTIYMYMYMYR